MTHLISSGWVFLVELFHASPAKCSRLKGFALPRGIALLLFLTVAPASAQSQRWEVIGRMGSRPLGLQAVDFIDSLHGWAAGASDSIFYTNDGGTSWASSSGEPMVIHAIRMRDTLTGWCAGDQAGTGRILHTSDGGRSWQQQYETPFQLIRAEYFYGLALAGSQTVVAAGYSASTFDTVLVVRSTDGGRSWQRTLLDTINKARHVQFVDSLTGFAEAADSVLYCTTDGGTTWFKRKLPLDSVQTFFHDGRLGWGAYPGRFFRTTDGGLTWQLTYEQSYMEEQTFNPERLSFPDSLYGWAFGWIFYYGILSEAIFRTTNGGTSWEKESEGLTDDFGILVDGLMVDRSCGYAISGDGSFLAYRRVLDALPPHRDGSGTLPVKPVLEQNYPNPFNSQTVIGYSLPVRSQVQLEVFDILGRRVAALVNRTEEAGRHEVFFQADGLPSGLYLYRLMTSQQHTQVRTMFLIK